MTKATWKTRIENLLANPDDIASAEEARRLAGSWATCGIGESQPLLRAKGYEFDATTSFPKNETIKELGDRFHGHIDAGRYESAMEYLRKVEAVDPCADSCKAKTPAEN